MRNAVPTPTRAAAQARPLAATTCVPETLDVCRQARDVSCVKLEIGSSAARPLPVGGTRRLFLFHHQLRFVRLLDAGDLLNHRYMASRSPGVAC